MMLKKNWFTLVEVLLVITIASSIITIIYSLLDTLPKVKNFNDARQTLIQQVNDAMDRFSILFQDYTIDYEEYYNRKEVWCNAWWWSWASFTWAVWLSGYCTIPTWYGNHHWSSNNHSISYNWLNETQPPYSYWEYKRRFWDFWTDTDWNKIWQKPAQFWDADDRDLWDWPIALMDSNNIQELYLISHDKSRRLFLRRKFNPYTEAQAQSFWSSWWYSIQILKLRWFDAGNMHVFTDPNADPWVFDWQIDTWACDSSQFFYCWWTGNTNSKEPYNIKYPWESIKYYLPKDNEDWWVNLFDEKLNIIDWRIEAYPIKDQDLAWSDVNQQINPYFKITITAWLSDHLASNRNWRWTWWFTYSLEDVFDTKGFYIQ